MKDQVTTIEQSKRLIEMGVPAVKASMAWVKDPDEGVYSLTVHDEFCYEMSCLEPRPAFTVADLLGMMPKDIPAAGEQKHNYVLMLSYCFCWQLYYENTRTHMNIGGNVHFNLVDLICDRIEWLVSNGYKLEL